METILQFFSDLILFTAGLVVVFLWFVILVAGAIEIYDTFTNNKEEEEL